MDVEERGALRLREVEEEVEALEGPFGEGETPEVTDPFCDKRKTEMTLVSTRTRKEEKETRK